jgi:hypothetical protein
LIASRSWGVAAVQAKKMMMMHHLCELLLLLLLIRLSSAFGVAAKGKKVKCT